MKRFLAGFVVTAATVLAATSAQAEGTIATYSVHAQARDGTKAAGESFVFDVRVLYGTRHGVARVGTAPAENTLVTVTLSRGRVLLWGQAVTDADGRATVKVRVPATTPAGSLDAFVYAEDRVEGDPCGLSDRYGYEELPKLVRVIARH